MNWGDIGILEKASFKKQPFFVTSHSFSTGRRIVLHEFPYHDKPYIEDLGRKSRTFNIEGFILGDNYFKDRNNFVKIA